MEKQLSSATVFRYNICRFKPVDMNWVNPQEQTWESGIHNTVRYILSGRFALSYNSEYLTSLRSKVSGNGVTLLDSRELSLFKTVLLEETRLLDGSKQLVFRDLDGTERERIPVHVLWYQQQARLPGIPPQPYQELKKKRVSDDQSIQWLTFFASLVSSPPNTRITLFTWSVAIWATFASNSFPLI